MLINKKGYKRQYVYGGSGFFDSLISAVTSKVMQDTAKEVATNIAKKTATDLGQKAVNKFIVDKVFKPKKANGNGIRSKAITPESTQLLNSLLGSGIKRI